MPESLSHRKPFSTLEEIVDPEHSAVLVVDMQNDTCVKGGFLDEMGWDISAKTAMVPTLVAFLAKARQLGILVVYSQHTTLPFGHSDSPAHIYFTRRRRRFTTAELAVEGTWGHRIVQELNPRDNEPIVRKHRASAFVGTDLDQILRCNGVQTVIVTGVATENCIESTARSAGDHDYYVVVVEDCIASSNAALHEASLEVLRPRYDVVPSQEIIRLWTTGRI
ncbi:MAG: cysteine hydrolase family protein [bacterium]